MDQLDSPDRAAGGLPSGGPASELRDAFRWVWQTGQRPRLEQFLDRADPQDREALFIELLAVEVECRQAVGEVVIVSEYRERFPDYAALVRVACGVVASELSAASPNLVEQPTRKESVCGNPSEVATVEFHTSPGAEAQAPPLPRSFGRYQVLGLLGQGGFGAVYLGYDDQLDRKVAIKVPRHDRAHAPDIVQHFLQEARRLARLRHPGIVTVHDVGVQEQQFYIISDVVEGTDLGDWLKSHHPTWMQSARLVAAVADALSCAHRQRIVHRDVKPSNILLTAELAPVLVDFGLALMGDEGTEEQRKLLAGTPAYMAPEQARGEGHRIDGRTDIYSLGVVLYRMLCGRAPFTATHLSELLRQVREDEPQPPRQLVPDLPAELERSCLKAMAKRIGDRHTTAADFAADLRNLLRASPEPEPASGGRTPRVEQRTGGSPPPLPAAPPVAERRPVTALFCRFDPHLLAEDIDPEDFSSVLPAYQEACAEVVCQAGGHIAQSLGEDLLVYFGYPRASEDAALRAVRTGLALVETVRRLAAAKPAAPRGPVPPLRLGVRVGLHTGWVVTSDKTASESVLLGEPRSVVNRLPALAEPDSVVLSAATYRLVQGFFTCKPLGSHALSGGTRHLEVFQALAESAAGSRIEVAGASGLTPLVGRDRELGLLLDRWEQVKEGNGQAVLLSGEPGIGKSRLLHEVRAHVRKEAGADDPPLLAELRCAPQYQNSDFHPVREHLTRALRFSRDEADAAKLARLEETLTGLGLSLDETVPLFAPLLALPLPERYQHGQPGQDPDRPLSGQGFAFWKAAAFTPQALRQKTLEALVEWLRRQAARRPMLLLVEDLHWIDHSTLELLSLTLEQVPGERLFLLLTCRPEFRSPWGDCYYLTRVALNRLTRRQVADMIERRSGCSGLPPEVAEQVLARTDGVPLFVEEMVKMVLESGLLRPKDGGFELTGALPARAIPDTLQDLLMARLDRLTEGRAVAQLGAALGREFSHEQIQAVLIEDCRSQISHLQTDIEGSDPSPPSNLNLTIDNRKAELERGLAQLVEAELLFRKGKPPQATYSFKHALIQDAAYQSLPRAKRQQHHRCIAETFERDFPETAQTRPELLAHHYTEAGVAERAVAYWEKAGRAARERSANAEAAGHLRRGLELLTALEPSAERDRLELRLQMPLGAAVLSTSGYAAPEVGTIYGRARELCLALGETPHLFHILWGLWAWRVVRDELDVCMELAPEVLRLAEAQNDPGLLMEAVFVPGLTQLYRGEFKDSRRHCEQGVALYDPERNRLHARSTGQNSGVTMRCYLALALWHLGYPDQALAQCAEFLALARTLKHPFTLAYGLHHAAWLHQHCRLGPAAQQLGQEMITLGLEQGFAFWKASGMLYRGAGLLLQGEQARGLADVHEGLAAYRATGAELALPYYLSFLAEAQAQGGRIDEALGLLDEALAAAERCRDRFHEAEIYRCRGELLLVRPPADVSAAEASFVRALETARAQGGRSWELRAALSLSRLWRRQGRSDEAGRLLAEVYGQFTEGLDTPDLADARALLAEWGLATV